MAMSALRRSVLFLLLLAGFAALATTGAMLKGASPKTPSFAYLPDPKFSRFLFPGQRSFGASLVWSSTVLYFADVLLEHEDPRFLADLVQTTNALDPQWTYPYEFGGLVVVGPDGHSPSDRTVAILQDGIRHHPKDWKLRVYLVNALQTGAFGFTKSALADTCARVLLPLSTGRMQAPEYVKTLAFTLLKNGGRPEEAMGKLTDLFRTVEDPLLQARFQDKMMDLLSPSLSEIGTDSADFRKAAVAMLRSHDPHQEQMASSILIALSDKTIRADAVSNAKALARQYRNFAAARN
jgi:hypothetical protein